IFSTKNRQPILKDNIRKELHKYLGGILRELDCHPIEINTEPDHAHLLFTLSRTRSISKVVQEVKSGSSSWLKKQSRTYADFHWQNGYGAFSVSQSGVKEVQAYIKNQRKHHRGMTFQKELREFLRRY